MPRKSAPPAPYPPEFRQRLIDLVRAGQIPEQLARTFEPSAPVDRLRSSIGASLSRNGANEILTPSGHSLCSTPECRMCHSASNWSRAADLWAASDVRAILNGEGPVEYIEVQGSPATSECSPTTRLW